MMLRITAALLAMLLDTGFAAAPADAPAASSLALIDPSKSAVSFTWEQLRRGDAVITISNPTAKPHTATATLTPFHPDSAHGGSLHWAQSEFKLTIAAFDAGRVPLMPAAPPTAAGGYSGFLTVQQTDEELKPVSIQVRIVDTTAQTLLSKLTVKFTRAVPFTAVYRSTAVSIPFTGESMPPPAHGGMVGALTNPAGGWVGVRAKGAAADHNQLFEVDPPPSAGTYSGDLAFAAGPDKSSLTLTVLVQDFFLWPVAIIAFGTWLAYLVKRYIGLLRIVWGLRQQEADLGEAFRKSSQQFAADTTGKPYAAYRIDDAIAARRHDVQVKLHQIETSWVTSIDDNNQDYKDAVAGIQKLASVIAAWGAFGGQLNTLATALDAVKTSIAGAIIERPKKFAAPPHFYTAANDLLSVQPIHDIANLDPLQKGVADSTALAKLWPGAVARVSAITTDFDGVRPHLKATDAEATHRQLIAVWDNLWSVAAPSDLDSLTQHNGDIDAAETALDQAKPQVHAAAAGRFRVSMLTTPNLADLMSAGATVSAQAAQSPASDERTAQLARHAIQFGDEAAAVFAGAVALLTGLNTYYVGKPFGTVGDYITVFLWAAGTKAALDILSGVFDKLTKPAPPKPAATPTA